MKISSIKSKRAAFEMSMATIVIIVLAVTMLMLGLVFVRQIFGIATKSVSIVDMQIREKLQTMFGEQGGLIVTYTRTVEIKPGTQGFSFPFAARTPMGEKITNRADMIYTVTKGEGNCVGVEKWIQGFGTSKTVDQYQGDASFSDIIITIPVGTTLCSQKINIDVKYKGAAVGGTAFTINVIRGGLFG